jgi:hypothetical protein
VVSYDTEVHEDLSAEDSGVHLAAYGLSDPTGRSPLYVHLLSEAKDPHADGAHATLRWLAGKRIRITIDVIE